MVRDSEKAGKSFQQRQPKRIIIARKRAEMVNSRMRPVRQSAERPVSAHARDRGSGTGSTNRLAQRSIPGVEELSAKTLGTFEPDAFFDWAERVGLNVENARKIVEVFHENSVSIPSRDPARELDYAVVVALDYDLCQEGLSASQNPLNNVRACVTLYKVVVFLVRR